MAGQLDDSDDNKNEDIHQQVVYLLGEAGQVDIHHLFNLDQSMTLSWSSNSAAASSSSIAAEAASDPNDHGIREVARIFSSDSILGYMKSSNDEEDEAMLSWRV